MAETAGINFRAVMDWAESALLGPIRAGSALERAMAECAENVEGALFHALTNTVTSAAVHEDEGRTLTLENLREAHRQLSAPAPRGMLYGREAEFINLPPLGRWAWWALLDTANTTLTQTRGYSFIVRAMNADLIGNPGGAGPVTARDESLFYPPLTSLNYRRDFQMEEESYRRLRGDLPALRIECERALDEIRDDIRRRGGPDALSALHPLVRAIRRRFTESIAGRERPTPTAWNPPPDHGPCDASYESANTSILSILSWRDPAEQKAERDNALRLLETVVGTGAMEHFKKTGKMIVKGATSGAEYVLLEGNITQTWGPRRQGESTRRAPRDSMRLCYELPGGYHPLDTMIAEILMIQTDEVRYLEIAKDQSVWAEVLANDVAEYCSSLNTTA